LCFSEGNLNLYFGSLCRLMADFLLPHQRRAVAARLSVKKGDEFTYDMPTGSGKSHLMQWEIKQAGSSRRILVVFPRLALLSQFYTRYVVDLSSVPVLVACTDQKDVRDTCDEDKADHCAGREARRRLKRSAGQTSILVLTTYVSLGVVLAECHTPFDLTLLDEAHHRSEPTVSATILEKRGHLGFVVNFSATPSEECGGPRFTYPFREAVDDGVIRDFTVHFIYVDKKTAGRSTAENVRRIGELTGNTKCMAFTSFAKADVEHRTSVSKAQKDFERTTKGRPWFVGGITAELDPRKRREFLQKFASADRSVLVSCRTLGEGIDVPGVNCVTFVDPRSSRREVMQIIGRALRVYRDDAGTPLPHQPDSTVVVPVVVDVKEYCALPDDEARDAYLRDQAASTEAGGSYETVLAVASSLKEQDQDLVELCFLYPAGPKTKEAVRSVRRARDLQGYRVVEVLRDGNCFFRSLERYVGKGCFEIRQEVVDELLRMPASERFEWGLEYDEAVERFRRDGEWANDVMDSVPVVAARLYGLDLGIFTDHTEEPFERYGSPGGVEVNLQLLDGHYNVLEPKDPATPPARKQPRRVHRRRFRGHFDPACKVLWSLQSEALSRGLAVVEHRLERLGVYVPSVEEKVEALCSLGSRPAQRKTPFPGNVVLDNPEGLPVADWNPGMFLKQLSGNWHPEKAPGTKLLEEQKKRVEALPWFQEVLEEWKAGWDRKTTLYHPSPTEKLEALCSLGSRSPLRKTPFPENVVLDNPEGLPVADWNPGMFLQQLSGNWHPEKVPGTKLSEERKRRLEALPWFQEVLEEWKAGWDRKTTLYHPSPTEKLEALCSLGSRPAKRNTHFPDDVTLDNPQGLPVADWNPGMFLQQLSGNWHPEKAPNTKLSEAQKKRVEALPWFQEVLEEWKTGWDRKTTLYHPSPTEKLEALCSLGSRPPLRKTPFPENVVLDNPEGLPVADWNPGMFLQHVSGNWLPEKVPSRKLSEEQKRRLEALPWFQEVLEGWKAGWDRKATLYHPSPTEKLAALCSLGRRPPLRNTHFPDDVTLDNPQGLSVADWNPGKLLQHLANNFQPGKTPGVKLSEEQKERVQALPWFQEVLEGWKRRWVVAQTESTEPELPSSREELNVDSAPRATPQRPSAPRRRSLDEVEAAVERELALLTVEELRDQLRQMKVREREASFRSYQGLNKGSKEVVNRLLAENLPAAGAVVVLDAEDFGTSTVLGPGVADRLVIPQRDPEVYEGMRTHPVFGHALIPGDLVHLEPDGPVGLVYADLMGSVKEARKVLARLAEWPLTHNAVVAVSVSCRDGEEADFTNQFSVKLLQSIHETFPGSSNLTPGVVLVYGEKVRMATVVVRLDNFTGLRRFNEEGQLPAGKK